MKKISVFGCLLFFVICCFGVEPSDKPFIHAVHKGAKAMMTFCVLDDEGLPLPGANIETGFDDPAPGQSIYNQQTDTNGFCVVTGNTRGGLWFRITKPDFYTTEGNYYFRSKAPPYVVDGKWNPWNSTNTVILKRIKNPVSMYVKKVETIIPVLGQPVGFDLEKGDWVAPHGTGSSSDFVFSEDCKYRTEADFESKLLLQFSKEADGIQPVTENIGKDFKSVFSSQHEASTSGYLSKWTKIRTFDLKEGWAVSEKETGIYYIFRARTVLDEHKKIVHTQYGKIYGPIEYYYKPAGSSVIRFTYYFNPDGTQNIEFDPAKNLFGGRDRFAP